MHISITTRTPILGTCPCPLCGELAALETLTMEPDPHHAGEFILHHRSPGYTRGFCTIAGFCLSLDRNEFTRITVGSTTRLPAVWRMTADEIIRATAARYTLDTRSSTPSGECLMSVDAPAGGTYYCAVGFYLTPENKKKFAGRCGPSLADGDDGIDELLIPEVHGHGGRFWQKLQSLHDNVENWTPAGLSATGYRSVATLLQEYGDRG